MVYIAMFAVLISICAWICVPTAVPFTMQTFAVFIALLLLGGKRGTIAVCLYIGLGAVGLPVFSGMRGGLGQLLGPTGGYIIGFVGMALIYWLFEHAHQGGLVWKITSLAVGLVMCYAVGTVWFMVTYARNGNAIGLGAVLATCVVPFILPDLAKLLLSVVVAKLLGPALRAVS